LYSAILYNGDNSNALMSLMSSKEICFNKSLLKRSDSTAGSRNDSKFQTVWLATEKARVPNVCDDNVKYSVCDG